MLICVSVEGCVCLNIYNVLLICSHLFSPRIIHVFHTAAFKKYNCDWLCSFMACQYRDFSNISSWCSALSHVWLSATPWTVTHQAPLSMEFFQTRILEWVTISSSRGSSLPRNWTFVSYVSCIGRRILYHQRHLGSPPLDSFSVLSFVNPALIHACTTRSFYKSMTIQTFLNEEW